MSEYTPDDIEPDPEVDDISDLDWEYTNEEVGDSDRDTLNDSA